MHGVISIVFGGEALMMSCCMCSYGALNTIIEDVDDCICWVCCFWWICIVNLGDTTSFSA